MCKLRTRTRTPSQPSYPAMTFMAHVAQERLRLDSALRYLSPFSLCPHFFPFLSHSCSFRRTVRHPFSSKRLPCKRSSTEMQCKKCHTLFQRRPCTRHPQTLTIYCQQCRPFPVCTTSTFHCDLSLLPYYALRPTPPLYLIALPCHFLSSSHIRYLFLTFLYYTCPPPHWPLLFTMTNTCSARAWSLLPHAHWRNPYPDRMSSTLP